MFHSSSNVFNYFEDKTRTSVTKNVNFVKTGPMAGPDDLSLAREGEDRSKLPDKLDRSWLRNETKPGPFNRTFAISTY